MARTIKKPTKQSGWKESKKNKKKREIDDSMHSGKEKVIRRPETNDLIPSGGFRIDL
jgi:hypothetical protein